MPKMLSIAEAAAKGVERVRQPQWANPLDHLKIDIIDGKPGPWLHLWCPFNRECNGRDPMPLTVGAPPLDLFERCFLRYDGPLPDSDEYKAAVAKFDGVLSPPPAP